METSLNNKYKAFTSLEQSKKLAEILPIESADMCYKYVLPKSGKIRHIPEIENPINALEWYNKGYTRFGKEPLSLKEYCIPCWSLAALLNVLPKGEAKDVDLCLGGYKGDKYIPEWFCSYEEEEPFIIEICHAPNAIDACYKMILKLHKSNLL